MADRDDRNFEPNAVSPRPGETTPRTPWLLWFIVAIVVILMVTWAIRKFGTRSSATPAVSLTTYLAEVLHP